MDDIEQIRLRWNGYAWQDAGEAATDSITFVMMLRQKPQWAKIFTGLLAKRRIRRRTDWVSLRSRNVKTARAAG